MSVSKRNDIEEDITITIQPNTEREKRQLDRWLGKQEDVSSSILALVEYCLNQHWYSDFKKLYDSRLKPYKDNEKFECLNYLSQEELAEESRRGNRFIYQWEDGEYFDMRAFIPHME